MNQKRGGFKRQLDPAAGNGSGLAPGELTGTPKQENVDVLVTVDEAAKLCRMSRAMFYKLCAAGKTPRRVKLGNLTRWRRQELLDWIKAGCPSREKWESMGGKK